MVGRIQMTVEATMLEYSDSVLQVLCHSSGRGTADSAEDCLCAEETTYYVARELVLHVSREFIIIKNNYRPSGPETVPFGSDATICLPLEATFQMMGHASFFKFCKAVG